MHKKVFSFFLDLVFPKHCLNCNQSKDWICSSCWRDLQQSLLSQSNKSEDHSVEHCDKILAVASYEHPVLSAMLHYLKYKYVEEMAGYLSVLVIDTLQNFKAEKIDFVIPVPLSRKRKLQRGFNQSELIAKFISQKFGWELDTQTLVRRVHTRPQVGLNAQQRLLNVQDIFSLINPEKFKNKTILLVDDVVTTGATMRECAKILKQSGSKIVIGLVVLNS